MNRLEYGEGHSQGVNAMRKRTWTVIRRIPIRMGVLIVLIIFGSGPAKGENITSVRVGALQKDFLVIGHRGAAGLAPENTLAAFKRALDLGVDAVELDVQLSADRSVIVYHDFTLKPEIARTPDGEWLDMWTGLPIVNLTLDELKTYDVGRIKPYSEYAGRNPDQIPKDGERIPTLQEVIELIRSHVKVKTRIWIEIKTSPEKVEVSSRPDTVAESVVKLLQQERFTERVRILSFDWRALVHIQEIAPDLPTVYLSNTAGRSNNIKPGLPGPSPWTAGFDVDDFNGSIPRTVKAAGGRFWAPRYNQVTFDLIKEAHRLGIRVFVWTVDRRDDMIRLMKMGVDGIITNRPDILNSVLNRF